MTLDDLWEVPPDDQRPILDRIGAVAHGELQEQWLADGLVILPRFLPEELVDAYNALWVNGWPTHDSPCPYLSIPELRALCTYGPLAHVLEEVIGSPMGVHLNLIGWTSTERDWHQDDYLNPPFINGHYCAVWMALGDIDPQSGPFQFVRGSHKWPLLRREKMLRALGEPLPGGRDGGWPKRSEDLLSPLFEQRFHDLGLQPESFIANKGDVLVWHAGLAHRGSKALVPGMERRAAIAHYSALNKRQDMPDKRQQGDGWFFVPPGWRLTK